MSDETVTDFLKAAIEVDESVYGYKKLTYYLRREYSLIINKKKVYRLSRKVRLLQPQQKKKRAREDVP